MTGFTVGLVLFGCKHEDSPRIPQKFPEESQVRKGWERHEVPGYGIVVDAPERFKDSRIPDLSNAGKSESPLDTKKMTPEQQEMVKFYQKKFDTAILQAMKNQEMNQRMEELKSGIFLTLFDVTRELIPDHVESKIFVRFAAVDAVAGADALQKDLSKMLRSSFPELLHLTTKPMRVADHDGIKLRAQIGGRMPFVVTLYAAQVGRKRVTLHLVDEIQGTYDKFADGVAKSLKLDFEQIH